MRPIGASSRKSTQVLAGLTCLLGCLFIANLALGPQEVRLSLGDLYSAIAQRLTLLPQGPTPAPDYAAAILWDIRLPRALCALFVGSTLAAAGIALQTTLANPLAEPYTLGVSAGAAVGVALVDLAVGAAAAGIGQAASGFAGGLLASAMVLRLATVRGRLASDAALLAGVVVGTLLWSLIPLMLALAHRLSDQPRLLFYLIGSLQSAEWRHVWMLAAGAMATVLAVSRQARELTLLCQGEEAAHHLGVSVQRVKRRSLWACALGSSLTVAVAGAIGFVGLVAPHLSRLVCGPTVSRNLAPACLIGSCMLLAADLVCRVWLGELPIGVVTALVGAPAFCWILRGKMRPREF